jgi:hypothetical protein
MAQIIQFHGKGFRARLLEAQRSGELVRLWRGHLEHGSFCGYVGGVGREFFVLRVIGDGITDDGIYVMRHRDITELEAPDKHAGFIARALRLKGIEPNLPDAFPLDDIQQVVAAAGARRPVIGIHVDSEDEAEVCYIGRLVGSEDDGFTVQEVSPDAEWLREPSFFGWDEVSTISMDDPYAQALQAVAGPAPALERADPGVGHAH